MNCHPLNLLLPSGSWDLREAWQIGENDPDLAALQEDDEPIVSSGVTDPPCNKALMRIRESRKKP